MALSDEDMYLAVAKELALNSRDDALWTKAFALENGDEAKTKAHYIRLRVEKLQLQAEPQAAPVLDDVNLVPNTAPQPVDDRRNLPTDDDLYRVAVGKNSAYYVERFRQMQAGSGNTTWNWSAFLFNFQWALYRKLWWQALLGLILCSVIAGIFGQRAPTIEFLLLIAVASVFGARGNYWCYRRASAAISSARRSAKSGAEIVDQATAQAGTTLVPVFVIGGVVSAVLLYSWAEHARVPNSPSLAQAPVSQTDPPPSLPVPQSSPPMRGTQKANPFDDLIPDEHETRVKSMRDAGVGGNLSEADVMAWGQNRLLALLGRSDAYQLATGGVTQWKSLYVSKAGYPPEFALFTAYSNQIDFIVKAQMICVPDSTRYGVQLEKDGQVHITPYCYKLVRS